MLVRPSVSLGRPRSGLTRDQEKLPAGPLAWGHELNNWLHQFAQGNQPSGTHRATRATVDKQDNTP
jgi:hypothetical protein